MIAIYYVIIISAAFAVLAWVAEKLDDETSREPRASYDWETDTSVDDEVWRWAVEREAALRRERERRAADGGLVGATYRAVAALRRLAAAMWAVDPSYDPRKDIRRPW